MLSRSPHLALGFACFAAACGPPEPPPKPAPVEIAPPPTAETTTTPPPDPPHAPEPFVIVLPANPACVLTGHWRARKSDTSMLVRPGGPAYATISSGDARLHFPVTGSPAGPGAPLATHTRPPTQGLELESDGLSIKGHVDSGATDLRAANAFFLSGLALPGHYTLLDWTEATPGLLTVTAPSPKALEMLSPPLTATRPCADIGLVAGTYAPKDAIAGLDKARPLELVTNRPVDIALDPGGKAVARAHADVAPGVVHLLEVRGASTKIDWEIGDLDVVGWVASQDVHKPKNSMGFGSGHGRLGGPHYADQYKKVVCSIDVQLVVEASGERALAGVIRRGTVIELRSTNDRYTYVRVRSSSIAPANDAEWMVPTADLAECQSPPE